MQHLQPGVEALARLGAGQHNPPLLLPPELPVQTIMMTMMMWRQAGMNEYCSPESEGGDHLPLIESHREVLLVGHDQQGRVTFLLLEEKSILSFIMFMFEPGVRCD